MHRATNQARIVVWGKGERGASCLKAVHAAGYTIPLVVGHSPEHVACPFLGAARALDLEVTSPANPNSPALVAQLKRANADLFVLAGYGLILRKSIIDLPRVRCINLHAGKLPIYRGSSPMNWALINGETTFTLSIIEVDEGIDTGGVLAERTFPIASDDTICELHEQANQVFPSMLLETVSRLLQGEVTAQPQDPKAARYFPRRFPDDGLIVWDMLTAAQIHNRIRALTAPYPGAFSFYRERKVNLLRSRQCSVDYRGEPGRVYRSSEGRLLVCAADRCVEITRATFTDTGENVIGSIKRYECLATMRRAAIAIHAAENTPCSSINSILMSASS